MARILSLEEAALQAMAVREKGGTVVLANGAFDLLHVGHVRYLEAARALGDWLVVAVNNDRAVRQAKGTSRPIVVAQERAELVMALRAVEAVVIFDEPTVASVILKIRPNIHAKGTDYVADRVPEAALVKSLGGQVAIVGDAKDHSTSEVIRRLANGHKGNFHAH